LKEPTGAFWNKQEQYTEERRWNDERAKHQAPARLDVPTMVALTLYEPIEKGNAEDSDDDRQLVQANQGDRVAALARFRQCTLATTWTLRRWQFRQRTR